MAVEVVGYSLSRLSRGSDVLKIVHFAKELWISSWLHWETNIFQEREVRWSNLTQVVHLIWRVNCERKRTVDWKNKIEVDWKKKGWKERLKKKSYRLKKKDWHRNRILGRVVRETKINRTSECLYLVMEKTRKSKRTPKFLTWATSLKLLPVTKKGWWSRMCVFIWGEDSELKYHWEFHNRNPFPERS